MPKENIKPIASYIQGYAAKFKKKKIKSTLKITRYRNIDISVSDVNI